MNNPGRLVCLLLLLFVFVRTATAQDFHESGIVQIQSAMAAGEVTSRQLVESYLQRIEEYDLNGPSLNAISNINTQALEIADKLDAERSENGPRGPLHGIPVIVKDNFETREMPLTAGSVLFADWYPKQDAYLVSRLRQAGAIILATANMHEFAMGVDTTASRHGQTLNPYALGNIPGGSSGGTGAAIAAGFATVGMGTDTCGSIRIPAAFNSLVSLRGTQGLASRSGIFPLAPTQDIGGPLALNVTDVAIVFDAIAGYDPTDPQTALSVGNVPTSYQSSLLTDSLRSARIGLLTELVRDEPEDEEVARVIDKAALDMKAQGATVIEIEIPGLKALKGSYLSRKEFKFALHEYLAIHSDAPVSSLQEIISSDEFHKNMGPRLQGAQAAVSLEEKEYLQLLVKHGQLRELILDVMARNELDAIMYPTMRRKAAKIGESQKGNNCYLSARSGLPAITVPAGFTDDGLPVGVELLGRAWDESLLLGLAYAYEQATKHRRPPDFTTSTRLHD